MTKVNNKEEALEHVRSVCPELMELSFGCVFEVKKATQYEELPVPEGSYMSLFDFQFDSQHFNKAMTINTALKIHFLDGKTTDYEVVKVIPFGSFKELQKAGNIKIIGHTPHLEHWLRGIGKYCDWDDYHSAFERMSHPNMWDYTKDGENQSEEFYQSYCEIVGI